MGRPVAFLVCALAATPARALGQPCLPPVVDPWVTRTLWSWHGVGSSEQPYVNVINTPLVGQLDDDDGNGVIDGRDTPDVVVVADDGAQARNGTLVVVDGRTGLTRRSWPGYSFTEGVAAAELDGVLGLELVAMGSVPGTVIAVHADGRPYWTTSLPAIWTLGWYVTQLGVADLDGDGQPEILVGPAVLDGRTGALEQLFDVPLQPLGRPIFYTEPSAVDVDGDGDQEVLIGGALFDRSSAQPLWVAPLALSPGQNGWQAVWPVAVQADGDDAPELAFVTGGGAYALFDDDHSLLASVTPTIAAYLASPPCVADFDGDGRSEIAWSRNTELLGIELDGTPLWRHWPALHDASGAASCAAFDFDDDGRDELLFGGEWTLSAFNGATGSLLATLPHASGTGFETPAIADVDGDGHADLVVGHNNLLGGLGGLVAYAHAGSGWAGTGSDWFVAAHRPGAIDARGRPTIGVSPWHRENRVRSRSVGGLCGDGFRALCEGCDDGNAANGDGCSSTCVVETLSDAGVGDGDADAGDGGQAAEAGLDATLDGGLPAEGDPDASGDASLSKAGADGGGLADRDASTPEPPEPLDGAISDDANALDDLGSADTSPNVERTGGCGCRAGPGARSLAGFEALFLLALLRRRSRAT